MKKKRTTKIIVHKQYPIIKLKVHDLEEDYDRISRVLCVTMFFWGGILSTYLCPRPRTEDNRTGGRKNADNPEGLPQKTRKRIANPQIDKKNWQEQKKIRKYHCQPQDRKINSEKRNCQPRPQKIRKGLPTPRTISRTEHASRRRKWGKFEKDGKMICQNTVMYGKIHHSSTNNWKTKPTSPEELRWNRARESPERPISSPLPDAPSRTRQRERAELTDSPTEPVHCSNETLAKKKQKR